MKPQKKILIVDDQEINRKILTRLLSQYYIITEAESGENALYILRNQGENISGVLLDLVMPGLDGYGVLEIMSSEPQLSVIPVIVMSPDENTDAEARALQLGARDFVTKPYNPIVLRRRLENQIALFESNSCIIRIEHDALTGLYNKDAFCLRASELLSKKSDREYILVAADIERFKLINDSYGTAQGDKLLSIVGNSLQQIVQAAGGICARHNSDHFVALVHRSTDDGNLCSFITNIRKKLFACSPNIKISLKFGVYPVDDLSISVSLMCDRAILAAESAKGHYDSYCAYYDDSIRRRMLREQQITDEMKSALESGQFQVYLQPKYDLLSEEIAGAEALVRWIHPTLGYLNPGEFIPLFERNGFITELDHFIWDQTCRTIAAWRENGYKHVPVSVNVSRKDIYKVNLPKILANMIQKHGLKSEQLHLEITETAYTENAQQLINVVDQLKKLGFTIEMDDFGSGYSSLNMLSELPIDILKLDMRLIQKGARGDGNRSILGFIINLAKWMKLLIVAEGVETREQVELLRNLGCNYVQGYYYAKPMPVEAFTDLLRRSATADCY